MIIKGSVTPPGVFVLEDEILQFFIAAVETGQMGSVRLLVVVPGAQFVGDLTRAENFLGDMLDHATFFEEDQETGQISFHRSSTRAIEPDQEQQNELKEKYRYLHLMNVYLLDTVPERRTNPVRIAVDQITAWAFAQSP